MKTHIEIEQLTELNAEQILILSNQESIDTVWMDWDQPEKVQSALDVFKEKGWKHDTLLKTAKQCNTANMIAILNEYGKINIENLHSEYGTKWYVSINHDVDMDTFHFEEDELCDALWLAVKKITYQ
ncbi:hypothetical protein [Bacillus paranthracis]|uniref:hypothetical protein n=1 Tax=Bacillus cereus group TaxID=86661 RepID=UPI001FFC2295|nr:hypothetical protein [Bacillus paranthracis]